MAEENAAPNEEFNDDGNKNPNYVAPIVEGEGAGSGTEKKGTEEEKKEVEADTVEDFNDTIDEKNPPKIPIRQNAAQNIIARQKDKIKKLESKAKEGEPGYVAPSATEEDAEDGSATDQEDKIAETVKKVLSPFLGKMASDADETEMNQLIAAEPEAKKYINHIKAYMAHETYKGVPPALIYHHLAFAAAQAQGAKRKVVADFEANKNKGGGRAIVDTKTAGELPSAEDINNMSDEEFDKLDARVSRGDFIKK